MVTLRINSKHDGRCDSPVTPWEKAIYLYVNSIGSLILLFQLKRKMDLHVSTQDKAWLPCGNSRGTPRSMSALERNPEIPASITKDDFSPNNDWRRIPRGPSQLAWGLDIPEETQAGLWGPICNSKRTPSFLPQLEKNQEILPSTQEEAVFTPASREKSHFPSWASKGSLTPLRQLKKFPDIPITTREKPWGSCHNSRRGPVFPPHHEMSFHFHALLGKESQHSHHPSRGGGLNLKLERNSMGRATISKDPDVPIHSRYTWLPCTDSMVTLSIESKHDGRCHSPVAPREKATDRYVNSTESLTLMLQL